jgi:hypothetical protein
MGSWSVDNDGEGHSSGVRAPWLESRSAGPRRARGPSFFSGWCIYLSYMSLNEANVFQNLPANDVRRSGDFFARQSRPIAQPQPEYGQPPHFQYMPFPPGDAQRSFERTTNVDDEEEEYEKSYTDMDGDEEEEGDAIEEEEGEEEEESDVEDEVDKPIVRVISGPNVFPIILIEPFFGKRDFDFLESISPKLAKLARKSADRRLWDCHREAAQVLHKLTKHWLRGHKNKRRDKKLILSLEGYCEKSRDEWREEVGEKLEKLRQEHQHKLLRRGDTIPTPETARQHRSGVKRDGEGPGDSQRQRWERTTTLHFGGRETETPTPTGTKRGRNGRIPGNIYERLELVVRERIENEKRLSHGDGLPTPKISPLVPKDINQAHATRTENLHRPLQTLRGTNTSTPSISQPMRVS